MKQLLLAALLILAGRAMGQKSGPYPYKTIDYLDARDHALPSAEGAAYRIESVFRDSLSGFKRRYNAAGKLLESKQYANMSLGIKLGPQTTFYENGQVNTKEDFVGNQRNGEFVKYYQDGKLKRRETYLADVRQTGECFAPDGSPVAFFPYHLMPTYNGGGQDNITRAIQANVRYPAVALRNNTQGRVFVTFSVSESGHVEDARIVKGVSPELDAATLDAVQRLGTFVPGQLDGRTVPVSFTVPITYSITQRNSTNRPYGY
jgi:protein TonB